MLDIGIYDTGFENLLRVLHIGLLVLLYLESSLFHFQYTHEFIPRDGDDSSWIDEDDVAGPARFWSKKVLHDIMTTCIIMHNMIIEDERDVDATIEERTEVPAAEVEMTGEDDARFQKFLARHRKIKNREAHIELRNDLIEHLWSEYTNSEN
ncbi:uncharacterized protein LOC108831479 [Raphanus sativus]|uniref:Uncharacterized protein LOC108831479 n=1 Tax=Raphanus sativus TaxID=3726 RepID=A0A9W3CD52_RAPSA|nr:uncharacterized protein LOC108831479 [Raphanus sativus]